MKKSKFLVICLIGILLAGGLIIAGCDTSGGDHNDSNSGGPKWVNLDDPIRINNGATLRGDVITFPYNGKNGRLTRSGGENQQGSVWTGTYGDDGAKVTVTDVSRSYYDGGSFAGYTFLNWTMEIRTGGSWVNYAKGTGRSSHIPEYYGTAEYDLLSITVTSKWDNGGTSGAGGGGNIPAALIGKWVSKMGNAMSFEITANGGCVFPGGALAPAGSVSVSGNTVTVNVTGGGGSFNYSISGNQLTMSNANGLFSGLDMAMYNPYTRN
ncbi:MAG: hypothetical protein LBQ69_05585 [Treponema sp.]|jgi:hypothetical protein|nr:hypothetical protein [Treponema sp.]